MENFKETEAHLPLSMHELAPISTWFPILAFNVLTNVVKIKKSSKLNVKRSRSLFIKCKFDGYLEHNQSLVRDDFI